MKYSVKQLAELAGISPRTLRYYHEIGLLEPEYCSDAGYRFYGSEQVDRLQQILFYRELGLPLSEISSLLDDPSFDPRTALKNHLTSLQHRRARLDSLIATVEKTLRAETGELNMTNEEKFDGFKKNMIQENEALYGHELREKYGDEAVTRSNARLLSMTETEYSAWTDLESEILSKLEQAVQDGADPSGEFGKQLAQLHRQWLCYTWPHYSPAAHKGLAQMYICDERFTKYYDRNLPGCAAFLCTAINCHM